MIPYAIVLHMTMAIAPGAEYTQDARPIMAVISKTANTTHEAAVLLVFAWHESSFKKSAVGDGGLAIGAWQLHNVPQDVLWNLPLAARIAKARLNYSEDLCKANPLAAYISGNCYSEKGKKISDLRMIEVKKLEHSIE